MKSKRYSNSNSSTSAGPLLRSLQWLPVRRRINFKLAKLCYLASSFQQPGYLADLISPYRQSRLLRSSTQKLLSVPPHNLDTAARRFSVAALWDFRRGARTVVVGARSVIRPRRYTAAVLVITYDCLPLTISVQFQAQSRELRRLNVAHQQLHGAGTLTASCTACERMPRVVKVRVVNARACAAKTHRYATVSNRNGATE